MIVLFFSNASASAIPMPFVTALKVALARRSAERRFHARWSVVKSMPRPVGMV